MEKQFISSIAGKRNWRNTHDKRFMNLANSSSIITYTLKMHVELHEKIKETKRKLFKGRNKLELLPLKFIQIWNTCLIYKSHA